MNTAVIASAMHVERLSWTAVGCAVAMTGFGVVLSAFPGLLEQRPTALALIMGVNITLALMLYCEVRAFRVGAQGMPPRRAVLRSTVDLLCLVMPCLLLGYLGALLAVTPTSELIALIDAPAEAHWALVYAVSMAGAIWLVASVLFVWRRSLNI